MLIPGVFAMLDGTKILFLAWRRSGVSASNHPLSPQKATDTPFTVSGVQVYRLHILAVLRGDHETTSKVRRHNQRAQILTVSFFSPPPRSSFKVLVPPGGFDTGTSLRKLPSSLPFVALLGVISLPCAVCS